MKKITLFAICGLACLGSAIYSYYPEKEFTVPVVSGFVLSGLSIVGIALTVMSARTTKMERSGNVQ